MHTNKLEKPISDLTFAEKSLLFAELSMIAYSAEKIAYRQTRPLGFSTIEYYNKDGAQAYRIQNNTDIVIACRGTEPAEFNDIKADLKAMPVIAETISRVHKGFKSEVDELWPDILEDLKDKKNKGKKIWFCGHSLGAAMATIMASRCHLYPEIDPVQELYTYGSPRVGWPTYVKSLCVTHHRWVNNNDIVTTVPLAIMGYKHHGEKHYLNAWGNVRSPSGWQLFKDKMRGMWKGIKQGKIDSFSDHSINLYVEYLANYRNGKEVEQI